MQYSQKCWGFQSIDLTQIREISQFKEGKCSVASLETDAVSKDKAAKRKSRDIPELETPGNDKTAFGEEAEKAPVTFLRGSTVLLKPGEFEGGCPSPIFPNSAYAIQQQRMFSTSLGLNVGILDNFEAWVDIPFAYVRGRSELAFESSSKTGRENKFALRDISIGGNVSLLTENDDRPEISLSASLSFPTGKSPYDSGSIYYSGSGHWRTTLGLNAVKSVDPAMIFMGAAIGYSWSTHENGAKLSYDSPDYSYYFGLGMAINDRLSFSTRFQGSYQPALKYDGDKEGRTSTDPMWAGIGFSYRMSSNLVLEPQVAFGLNDAAEGSNFRLGLSRKF